MAKVQILRNPISRQKILINDLQNILKLSNLMHKEDYKLYQIAMKTYPGYIQTYQSLEKLTQNPKPNILLVHGYCFSIADWHKTLPYLQNHYNVYAIDQYGTGTSYHPKIQINNFNDAIDLFCDSIEQWRCHSGAKINYIVAHSLGAFIISHYLRLYKPHIDGVILVAPLGFLDIDDKNLDPSYLEFFQSKNKELNIERPDGALSGFLPEYVYTKEIVGKKKDFDNIFGRKQLKLECQEVFYYKRYYTDYFQCKLAGDSTQPYFINKKIFSRNPISGFYNVLKASYNFAFVLGELDVVGPKIFQSYVNKADILIVENSDHMILQEQPGKLSKTIIDLINKFEIGINQNYHPRKNNSTTQSLSTYHLESLKKSVSDSNCHKIIPKNSENCSVPIIIEDYYDFSDSNSTSKIDIEDKLQYHKPSRQKDSQTNLKFVENLKNFAEKTDEVKHQSESYLQYRISGSNIIDNDKSLNHFIHTSKTSKLKTNKHKHSKSHIQIRDISPSQSFNFAKDKNHNSIFQAKDTSKIFHKQNLSMFQTLFKPENQTNTSQNYDGFPENTCYQRSSKKNYQSTRDDSSTNPRKSLEVFNTPTKSQFQDKSSELSIQDQPMHSNNRQSPSTEARKNKNFYPHFMNDFHKAQIEKHSIDFYANDTQFLQTDNKHQLDKKEPLKAFGFHKGSDLIGVITKSSSERQLKNQLAESIGQFDPTETELLEKSKIESRMGSNSSIISNKICNKKTKNIRSPNANSPNVKFVFHNNCESTLKKSDIMPISFSLISSKDDLLDCNSNPNKSYNEIKNYCSGKQKNNSNLQKSIDGSTTNFSLNLETEPVKDQKQFFSNPANEGAGGIKTKSSKDFYRSPLKALYQKIATQDHDNNDKGDILSKKNKNQKIRKKIGSTPRFRPTSSKYEQIQVQEDLQTNDVKAIYKYPKKHSRFSLDLFNSTKQLKIDEIEEENLSMDGQRINDISSSSKRKTMHQKLQKLTIYTSDDNNDCNKEKQLQNIQFEESSDLNIKSDVGFDIEKLRQTVMSPIYKSIYNALNDTEQIPALTNEITSGDSEKFANRTNQMESNSSLCNKNKDFDFECKYSLEQQSSQKEEEPHTPQDLSSEQSVQQAASVQQFDFTNQQANHCKDLNDGPMFQTCSNTLGSDFCFKSKIYIEKPPTLEDMPSVTGDLCKIPFVKSILKNRASTSMIPDHFSKNSSRNKSVFDFEDRVSASNASIKKQVRFVNDKDHIKIREVNIFSTKLSKKKNKQDKFMNMNDFSMKEIVKKSNEEWNSIQKERLKAIKSSNMFKMFNVKRFENKGVDKKEKNGVVLNPVVKIRNPK